MIGPRSASFSLEELRCLLPLNAQGEHPSRQAVLRWLKREGIPVQRIANAYVVWLADLAASMPQLQRSLELRRVA